MFSFDDIRSYLDSSGANEEAERYLNSESGKGGTAGRAVAPTTLGRKPAVKALSAETQAVKANLVDRKQLQRDDLLRMLVSEQVVLR
jgi:hypothetical protein